MTHRKHGRGQDIPKYPSLEIETLTEYVLKLAQFSFSPISRLISPSTDLSEFSPS
jgi:hypothetical protein